MAEFPNFLIGQLLRQLKLKKHYIYKGEKFFTWHYSNNIQLYTQYNSWRLFGTKCILANKVCICLEFRNIRLSIPSICKRILPRSFPHCIPNSSSLDCLHKDCIFRRIVHKLRMNYLHSSHQGIFFHKYLNLGKIKIN